MNRLHRPASFEVPEAVAPASAGLPRGFAVIVGGVMAAGALSGFLLNRSATLAKVSPGEAPPALTTAARLASREGAAEPVHTLTREEPQPAAELVAPVRRLRVRAVTITPPDDPFQPSQPVVATAPLPVKAVQTGAPGANPGEFIFSAPVARTPAAGPAPAAAVTPAAAPAPAGPRPEEIVLTGIIQGEPPLAVIRHGGQSHFLKIGDKVADSWRLEEIKERSAVLKLGGERVEIPIQGGSSQ